MTNHATTELERRHADDVARLRELHEKLGQWAKELNDTYEPIARRLEDAGYPGAGLVVAWFEAHDSAGSRAGDLLNGAVDVGYLLEGHGDALAVQKLYDDEAARIGS